MLHLFCSHIAAAGISVSYSMGYTFVVLVAPPAGFYAVL